MTHAFSSTVVAGKEPDELGEDLGIICECGSSDGVEEYENGVWACVYCRFDAQDPIDWRE